MKAKSLYKFNGQPSVLVLAGMIYRYVAGSKMRNTKPRQKAESSFK